MLRYVALGERDYLRRPILSNRRPYWELEAVLSGRIAPTLRHAGRPVFQSRWLWILPPQTAHGWTGDGRPARVAVFHLSDLPHLLKQAAGAEGTGLALTDDDAASLADWAEQALADRRQPTGHAALREARIVAELTLLAARIAPEQPTLASPQRDQRLVDDAETWLHEHLHDGAGLVGAAHAVGISPAHLRRLVHRVRGVSPRALLADLRMSRARELLNDPDLGLEPVAAACGFASAAAFCRAHRRTCGTAPRGGR